jgi:hypothetical protein
MRTFIAAVIIALLTVPSYAQGMGGQGMGSQGMSGGKGRHGHTPDGEQPKKKSDDRAYKSALDRLPDKKFDPWGSVRETPQPK